MSLNIKIATSSNIMIQYMCYLFAICSSSIGMKITCALQVYVKSVLEKQKFIYIVGECIKNEHAVILGNMASNPKGEMAIPLCLPNNYKWDSETRKCIDTGDERSSLYVVEEALEKLRIIKGKYSSKLRHGPPVITQKLKVVV